MARQQAGAFTRSQARDSGLSDDQIDRRLATGRWTPLFPQAPLGVFIEAATPPTRHTRVWGCLLVAGPRAALGDETAAWLWGWCEDPPLVRLVLPPEVRRRVPHPGRARRAPLPQGNVVRCHGFPATSQPRTIADCLRFLPRGRAADILDRSQQRRGPSLLSIAAALPVRGPGSAQARSLLAAADGTRFEAERRCARLLRKAGFTGWAANHPVRLGSEQFVLDFAFAGLKVAVEVDGFAYHSNVDRFQRDRRRQNALVRAGWIVLRFTWHDIVERPDAVVAEIHAVIASRLEA